MMTPNEIAPGVTWVGVNDRVSSLFEGLWPLPHGVSYNSYLVEDAKTALVDAVKEPFEEDFLETLGARLDGRPVDYLVVNHLEPDHSGAIRCLRRAFPALTILGTGKCREFLEHLHAVTDGVRVVGEGDELDLGGRVLRFHPTPMVHWPETMVTHDPASGTLFTGDLFGGYGALDGAILDDETPRGAHYEAEALRYFANVLAKYAAMVQKALGRVRDLAPKVLAPSHGLVWRRDPARIVDLYDRWSRQEGDDAVALVYGSMYGHTASLAEDLARHLTREGVPEVRMHDLTRSHLSFALQDAWRSRALVIGTPTYNLGVFPPVDAFLRLLEDKRLGGRIFGAFGSYGWSGGGVKAVRESAARMGWELVEPVVEARFAPAPDNREACRTLARNVARRLAN